MKNCLVTKLKADTGNFDLPRVDYVVGRVNDSQFTPTSTSYIRSVYNENCELIIKGDGNFLNNNTLGPLPSPYNKTKSVFASDRNNPIWLPGGKYQVLFPKKYFGGFVEINVPLFVNVKDLYSVNFKNYIFVKNINGTMQEIANLAKNKNKPLSIHDSDISFNTEQLKDITILPYFIKNPNVEGDISNMHLYTWDLNINFGGCPKLYGSVEIFFDDHINRLNLSSKEGYFYTEAMEVKFHGVWHSFWYYTILENGDCKIYSDSDRQTLVGIYSKETRQWTYQS